jgi:hypothetical protein
MRIAAYVIVVAAGAAGLLASAFAADLTGPELKAYLSGRTLYLETTAASATGQAGQGAIYWSEDGTALYKTPTGALWHGKWEIKGNMGCTAWQEKPGTGCVRYDRTGDAVTLIDATSGQIRAKVTKTAAGNAEKLVP